MGLSKVLLVNIDSVTDCLCKDVVYTCLKVIKDVYEISTRDIDYNNLIGKPIRDVVESIFIKDEGLIPHQSVLDDIVNIVADYTLNKLIIDGKYSVNYIKYNKIINSNKFDIVYIVTNQRKYFAERIMYNSGLKDSYDYILSTVNRHGDDKFIECIYNTHIGCELYYYGMDVHLSSIVKNKVSVLS